MSANRKPTESFHSHYRNVVQDPRIQSVDWLGRKLRVRNLIHGWCEHPSTRDHRGGTRGPLELLQAHQDIFRQVGAADLGLQLLKPLAVSFARDCVGAGTEESKALYIDFLQELAAVGGLVVSEKIKDLDPVTLTEWMKDETTAMHTVVEANADGVLTRDELEQCLHDAERGQFGTEKLIQFFRRKLGMEAAGTVSLPAAPCDSSSLDTKSAAVAVDSNSRGAVTDLPQTKKGVG